MATKQVQSFQEYFDNLEYQDLESFETDSKILFNSLTPEGYRVRKMEFYDFKGLFGNYPTYDVEQGEGYSHIYTLNIDRIIPYQQQIVCIPDGISLSDKGKNATLKYGEINTKDYCCFGEAKLDGIVNDSAIATQNLAAVEAYFDSISSGSGLFSGLSAEECHFQGIGNYEDSPNSKVIIFSKLSLRPSCGITWEGHESENKVFNTAGGATDIYSKAEIDTKLESLSGQDSSDLQKYLGCETITDSQGNQVEVIRPKCIDYGVWVSGCFNFDAYNTPFPKNIITWSNEVTLSEYGHDSTDKTGCVKMIGTYAMDTACVKDLYVKNLHSSLQSNTMDEIKVDSISAKNSEDNIYFGSGITFHGNPNYSLIKYEEINLSQYGFGNRTINGHSCWGDFLFGNDIYATSNLYAWDVQLGQDGGTVKSLKEIIAKLEARIAALESK